MPDRARASAVHEPTPPTPTIATWAARSFSKPAAPYRRAMPPKRSSKFIERPKSAGMSFHITEYPWQFFFQSSLLPPKPSSIFLRYSSGIIYFWIPFCVLLNYFGLLDVFFWSRTASAELRSLLVRRCLLLQSNLRHLDCVLMLILRMPLPRLLPPQN